jgi:antitoxin ParD1/3/4
MSKHTSVTLGDHFQEFVDAHVQAGLYGSASEVVRDALRLLERKEREEDAKMQALPVAIGEGISSGRADYSLEKLNAQLDDEPNSDCRLSRIPVPRPSVS